MILDEPGLTRLLAWLSPSYPVGSYSYSHGLEWAVAAGEVCGRATLQDWVTDVLMQGSGRNDAILFHHAHRAAGRGHQQSLAEICELAIASAVSAERRLETTAQGNAFVDVTMQAWPCRALGLFRAAYSGPVAYPIAVALAAAGHGVATSPALHAYLHAFGANLVSAGVRLVPLGQTDGQRAIAALAPVVGAVVATAAGCTLDDLGGAAIRAEIAAMRHETQTTRLFRT
jgi:urease accessory protein